MLITCAHLLYNQTCRSNNILLWISNFCLHLCHERSLQNPQAVTSIGRLHIRSRAKARWRLEFLLRFWGTITNWFIFFGRAPNGFLTNPGVDECLPASRLEAVVDVFNLLRVQHWLVMRKGMRESGCNGNSTLRVG